MFYLSGKVPSFYKNFITFTCYINSVCINLEFVMFLLRIRPITFDNKLTLVNYGSLCYRTVSMWYKLPMFRTSHRFRSDYLVKEPLLRKWTSESHLISVFAIPYSEVYLASPSFGNLRSRQPLRVWFSSDINEVVTFQFFVVECW